LVGILHRNLERRSLRPLVGLAHDGSSNRNPAFDLLTSAFLREIPFDENEPGRRWVELSATSGKAGGLKM
jgi:hypothetical protein